MLSAFLAIIAGWFINLVTLFNAEVVTGFTLIQAIGIIAFPIGVVTGYISLFI
jgi:hypothetical protein